MQKMESHFATVDQSDEIGVGSFSRPGVIGPVTVRVVQFLELSEPTEEEFNGWVLFELGQVGEGCPLFGLGFPGEKQADVFAVDNSGESNMKLLVRKGGSGKRLFGQSNDHFLHGHALGLVDRDGKAQSEREAGFKGDP